MHSTLLDLIIYRSPSALVAITHYTCTHHNDVTVDLSVCARKRVCTHTYLRTGIHVRTYVCVCSVTTVYVYSYMNMHMDVSEDSCIR